MVFVVTTGEVLKRSRSGVCGRSRGGLWGGAGMVFGGGKDVVCVVE